MRDTEKGCPKEEKITEKDVQSVVYNMAKKIKSVKFS